MKPEGVKGECFNVSASEYETLKSIVGAVAREYGVDVKWGVDDSEGPATNCKFSLSISGLVAILRMDIFGLWN